MEILYTTPLHSSPHPDKKIILAGDWCIDGGPVYDEILEYPIEPNNIKNISIEIWGVKELLLEKLAKIYNKTFNLKLTISDYEKILGSWLIFYLNVIYEKRLIISSAVNKHENVYIQVTDKPVKVAYNTLEFMNLLYENNYFNYSIYSKIFREEFSHHNCIIENFNYALEEKTANDKLLTKVKNLVESLMLKISTLIHSRIALIIEPYYERNYWLNAFLIYLRSYGRIIHFSFGEIKKQTESNSNEIRSVLKKNFCENVEGSNFFTTSSRLLFNFIPIVFVERFAAFHSIAGEFKRKYPQIKRIFSANAFSTNELYKHIISGTPSNFDIYITQHGSGYGFLDVLSSEKFESKIATKYLTWGWTENYLPHPKMSSFKYADYAKNSTILLTCPTVTKYGALIEGLPVSSNYSYIEKSTNLFISSLSEKLIKKINLRQRILSSIRFYEPERIIKFDKIKSFKKSLKKTRIHISNHFGTPALESLAANIPTIIFCDSNSLRIRRESQEFFNKLRQVNILFESELDAAIHLEMIYEDIDRWWLNESTQKARVEFVNQFARGSRHWMKIWCNELLKNLGKNYE